METKKKVRRKLNINHDLSHRCSNFLTSLDACIFNKARQVIGLEEEKEEKFDENFWHIVEYITKRVRTHLRFLNTELIPNAIKL